MAETTVLRSNAINRTPNGGAKPQAQLSGALPVVQVNMNTGGPQVQGGQGTVRQGVTILPPKAGTQRFTTGGLPNQPAKQGVVILPPKELRDGAGPTALTADQLLLCRHLADKYLGELRTAAGEAQVDEATANNIKLAEATIVTIDKAMVASTAAAAAAAAAAAPAPRAVAVGARGGQGAATSTPRRVARPAPPPVVVKMDSGQPILQADPTEPSGAEAGPTASDAQG
jgi:hypothetical protein